MPCCPVPAPAAGATLRHTSMAARLARHSRIVDGALQGAGRDPATFNALVELGLGRGLLTPRALAATAAGLRAPQPPHQED